MREYKFEKKLGGHRSYFRVICKRLFIFRKIVIFFYFSTLHNQRYFWSGHKNCIKFNSKGINLKPDMSSMLLVMCKHPIMVVQGFVQAHKKWVKKFFFGPPGIKITFLKNNVRNVLAFFVGFISTLRRHMIKRIVCAVQLKQKKIIKINFKVIWWKWTVSYLKFLTSQPCRGINSGSNGGLFVKFG